MDSNLKNMLEEYYKEFNKKRISPDPLEFLHYMDGVKNIEAAGFLASAFAYGRISQFMKVLSGIFLKMQYKPYDFLMNSSENSLEDFDEFGYRFYSGNDTANLMKTLREVYVRFGGIREVFVGGDNPSDKNIKNALSGLSRKMSEIFKMKSQTATNLSYFFPDPFSGSACKRMNLFLRWMVRKDELDFGIWKDITPARLIIPVDVHISRIAIKLDLTSRKNISWKMAEEITDNLKIFCSEDPVKYDFALCHIGMRQIKFNY